jgi:[acyl-carrier-protein] S-malonyltransferase
VGVDDRPLLNYAMDVVLLFPGQGSQKPGMGKDLSESFSEARRVFELVDAALDAPLSRLLFEGPADELTLTHNAQPALLAHGAAAWAVTRDHLAPRVRAAAGHSLGEFTAYQAAGALELAAAARLVRRRGELMYETGVARPGAMAALLGELQRPVEEICREASSAGEVVPANYNDAMQIVVSGEVAGVERAMELAKAAGAKRAVRLPVSGAFHSPLMEPAATGLRTALAESRLGKPAFPVYSNVTEQPVTEAAQAADLLVRQLTSPVRWVGEVRNLAATYPDALFVEMGPGSVLSGLVKRIAPAVRTAPCGTTADIERLTELVAQ